MKSGKLLVVAAAAFWAAFSCAPAQTVPGRFPPWTVYGNSGATEAAPRTVPLGDIDSTINCKQFGALGNAIADDTDAINACIAFAHTFFSGGGPTTMPVRILLPPGLYKISGTINMTGWSVTSGQAVTFDGYGAWLFTQAATNMSGKSMFDMMGSFSLRIQGITIASNNCTAGQEATTGIQMGKLTAAIAGTHKFIDVNVQGCYTVGSWYNFGAEVVSYINIQGLNGTTTAGAYNLVMDGNNYFGVPTVATGGQTFCPGNGAAGAVSISVGTPAIVTWTNHPFLNSNMSVNACTVVFTTTGTLPTGITAGTTYFVVPAGRTANIFNVATSNANALAGTAINTTGTTVAPQTATPNVATHVSFLGNVFLNPVFKVTGSGTAVPMYLAGDLGQITIINGYANSFATRCIEINVPSAGSNILQQWNLELHCEAGMENTFVITGTHITAAFKGFRFNDPISFVNATTGSVFATGGSIATVTMQNADFNIGSYVNSTAKVFDTPANYSMSGNYYSSSSTQWNAPATFSGRVCLALACDIYPVIGLVSALPTCNTASKGARRFVTNNLTAAAYRGAVTNGGAVQGNVYCDGTNWLQN